MELYPLQIITRQLSEGFFFVLNSMKSKTLANFVINFPILPPI